MTLLPFSTLMFRRLSSAKGVVAALKILAPSDVPGLMLPWYGFEIQRVLAAVTVAVGAVACPTGLLGVLVVAMITGVSNSKKR
jgi:hypothetical protein